MAGGKGALCGGDLGAEAVGGSAALRECALPALLRLCGDRRRGRGGSVRRRGRSGWCRGRGRAVEEGGGWALRSEPREGGGEQGRGRGRKEGRMLDRGSCGRRSEQWETAGWRACMWTGRNAWARNAAGKAFADNEAEREKRHRVCIKSAAGALHTCIKDVCILRTTALATSSRARAASSCSLTSARQSCCRF